MCQTGIILLTHKFGSFVQQTYDICKAKFGELQLKGLAVSWNEILASSSVGGISQLWTG